MEDIFLGLLWGTVALLFISGIDDMYLDLLFWLLRGRYKSKFPDFSTMHDYPEKPIAIMLGAWNESRVIGRTLSYAVRNIKYKNYRIFVGVYPNDLETIRVVKEIARKDSRVIPCINPQDGPTTKADNLNSLYAGLSEFENVYGEFEIIIIHDAEDFIHSNSLKLYNFLLGYKGYHGVQIPVIPIKSKLGKLYHKTYCDAFAEIHTKDMIVRQGMGTFIPFSGTGMAFHRKAIYYLEKNNSMLKNPGKKNNNFIYLDGKGREVELTEEYFKNTEASTIAPLHINDTNYHDDPFSSLIKSRTNYKRTTQSVIRRYTATFMLLVSLGIGYMVYAGNDEAALIDGNKNSAFIKNVFAGDKKLTEHEGQQSVQESEKEIKNENYTDLKYKASYIPLEKGKYEVQESSWGSYEEAINRLNALLKLQFLDGATGYINKSLKDNKLIYLVVIGKFETINEARAIVIQVREVLKSSEL